MTALEASGKTLDIGRVIELTFAAVGRNLRSFSIVSLLYAAPYFISQLFARPGPGVSGTGMIGGLFGLVGMVVAIILQGGLIRAAASDLMGRQLSPREVFNEGLEAAARVLVVSILVGLAVLLGLVLFVVPGVILGVMWSASVPAAAIERVTATAALRRSADLTRGNRWPIFFLLLIYLLAAAVVGVVSTMLTAGVVGLGALRAVSTGLAAVVSSGILVVGSVMIAMLFHELRLAKEGVGAESLASVFD